MTKIDAVNRRAQERIVFLVQTVCHSQLDSTGSDVLMRDLSLGGCLVRTERLLPPGDTIDLKFTLPGSEQTIRATGTVKWTREVGPPEQRGTGIEFTFIRRPDLRRLRTYIAAELKRAEAGDAQLAKDRRRAPRAAVDFDLTVRVERGYTFYTGRIRDIAGGGIYIFTREPHEVGERLTVKFRIPALDKTIETTGVVKWCLKGPTRQVGGPGVGIEFTGLSEQTVAELNEYIADKNLITREP